ncbi:MAG TPA: universal stress protein [Acidimicrobiia bacterium]|nr:universal stress protein [Acidimicrobiia bacterium]
MSRTLAFGDDGSKGADTCWRWIISQRWEGWGLEVVTCTPPADMRPVPPEAAQLHPWDPERPRDPGGAGFDSVTHSQAEVDPRLALISRVWDLVAIGPRGSGLLKSLHLGSTADWLLREPTSPLVVARRPDPVRRVLVATDGSTHAARAISTLASLPWLPATSIRILSVDDGRIDAEGSLAAAWQVLAQSGAATETVTRKGTVTAALLAETEEWGADLVAMGARGHSGLKRLVIGSSTAAIAGSIDSSVLVAHATPS